MDIIKKLSYFLFALFIIPCYAMRPALDDAQNQIATFTSSNTVSEQCITILAQLDVKRICKDPNFTRPVKTLPLKNYHTAQLIEFLCDATKDILKKEERWYVLSFHALHSSFLPDSPYYGLDGIQELVEETYIPSRCSLPQLQTAFDKIINDIQTGWRHSTPTDHPDIIHRPKKESLLVKPYSHNKHLIIDFLLPSLGLQNDSDEVDCSDNETRTNKQPSLLMLWIKKCAFDKVIQTLGIKEIG